MAKDKLIKVRQTQNVTMQMGGFGQLGDVRRILQERVIEVPEAELVDGAEVVSNDTPVHDWQEVQV